MLASATDFELQLLQTIWQSALVLACLAFLMPIGLVLKRKYEDWHQSRRSTRQQQLSKFILAALRSPIQIALKNLPELKPADEPIIVRTVLDMLRVMRGNDGERIIQILKNWNLFFYLRRQSERGSRGRRIQAITLLGHFNDMESLVVLMGHTGDKDMYVQLAALRCLAERRATKYIGQIVARLQKTNKTNALMLADVLGRFGETAVPSLIKLLQSRASSDVRVAAIMAVDHIGSLETIEPLLRILNDPDAKVRAQVACTLGRLGDTRAGQALTDCLEDRSHHVRLQAAIALGKLSYQHALPSLVKALNDKEWWIRFRAAQALYKLGNNGIAMLRSFSRIKSEVGILSAQVLGEMESMMQDLVAPLSDFFVTHSGGLVYIAWGVLILGIIQNTVFALQLPSAWAELRAHSQAEDTESGWQMLVSDVTIPISILIPAYNEEETIVANVHTMLSLQYPQFEVVVANDGSRDGTLKALIDAFVLKPTVRAHQLNAPCTPIRGVYTSPSYPNLVVVDKEPGGCKADANNAAMNFARHPLFCVIDADSLLEPEALLRAARPFMEEPERMAAVGGTIRILNGCTVTDGRVSKVGLSKHFLPRVQSMEYIRSFLMARLAWSRWGMLSIVSGAFGIFRRDIAIEAGGYSRNTVGEDFDLIINMHKLLREQKRPYEMRYVPEPVCWTAAPSTLKDLASQRTRWQRGALEVFFNHCGMFLNPRYGKIGFGALSHHFIIDVMGPLIEVIGYCLIPIFWVAGLLTVDFMLAYMAMFFMFGVFISAGSLFLEEMELRRVPNASDLARLFGIAVIENFGYRQLNNIWRFIGWWKYLSGTKGWGQLQRASFQTLC